MTALPVGFPSGPLFDLATGEVTPSWRAFFLALWQRTGGAIGIITTDTASLSAALAAETTARQTADAGLTTSIATERSRAETAEAALGERISFETIQRGQVTQAISQFTSANYVLSSQLAAVWASKDYSFLPHNDPTGGKPWLDGDHLMVGSEHIPIELESGAGRWEREDGTGAWLFG